MDNTSKITKKTPYRVTMLSVVLILLSMFQIQGEMTYIVFYIYLVNPPHGLSQQRYINFQDSILLAFTNHGIRARGLLVA